MNHTYQIKKALFAIPRKKFRTIIGREVWLWTQKELNRFESTWRLAFRHKEE